MHGEDPGGKKKRETERTEVHESRAHSYALSTHCWQGYTAFNMT